MALLVAPWMRLDCALTAAASLASQFHFCLEMIVSLIGLATYASAQSRQQDPLQSARPDEHDRSGRDSITHIDSSTYARQHFVLVLNRQGKTRLAKHFEPYDDEEKVRIRGEVHRIIAPRDSKYQSNFVEVRMQAELGESYNNADRGLVTVSKSKAGLSPLCWTLLCSLRGF